MSGNKKYTFRKFLAIAVWVLLGSGTVVLLIAAITKKDNERITGIEIHISGVQNNYFIDKKDVLELLGKVNGKELHQSSVSSLDLAAMERKLESDQWVKKAEIFFDNNNVLQVRILEREPVARIFTASGASFYIDSSLTRLPLSDKFSARLPVFTNFPTDVKILKKQDSLLLHEIKVMSEYIGTNSFWMAQIDQVDITPENTFVLIPKLGNQIIRFGNADNCEKKFSKLFAFYKQVQAKIGWSTYSVVDVQFKNQVVAVKRDAAEIRSDSLRTVQIMKSIIAEARKNIEDSTKVQLPQSADSNDKINAGPLSKDTPDDKMPDVKTPEIKSNEKELRNTEPDPKNRSTQAAKPVSRAVKKDMPDKKNKQEPASVQERIPKAVMPAKSDY
jgi:cell division protein FtsQ